MSAAYNEIGIQVTTQPSTTDAGAMTATFGYYPVVCDLGDAQFSIQTLAGHEDTVAAVTGEPSVCGEWIYPGPQRQLDFMSGHVRELPYSSRLFGLPKTHSLTLNGSWSQEDLEFVVWCLSFFTGMRLTTTECGFLDATPIQPGRLVDFVLIRCTLADVVHLALRFLDTERAGDLFAPKRVAAVIHALFLAQRPQAMSFERFQYLYMALDACFALISDKEAKKPRPNHAGRIEWMCGKFGMQVPPWATPTPHGGTRLAMARNDTFHEALFFDEPLGFALFGGNQRSVEDGRVTLQMKALINRLLVAILGQPDNDYVRMPVNTRGRYALNLRP